MTGETKEIRDVESKLIDISEKIIFLNDLVEEDEYGHDYSDILLHHSLELAQHCSDLVAKRRVLEQKSEQEKTYEYYNPDHDC